ncbi:MAG: hypothetical protein M3Q52_06920 [Pseudomonadota bacterium]|nr:hypothetical protein [Pseudomonadota bacterium]
MTDPEIFPLVLGTGMLCFSVAIYVRRRRSLTRTFRDRQPIAVDGWLTLPHELEYEGVYIDEKNEAFGKFCSLALAGVALVAAAYGLKLHLNIFDVIGHTS